MGTRDGGPAFPVTFHNTSNVEKTGPSGAPMPPMSMSEWSGMDLRDYFAAAALQGWLASWPATAGSTIGKESRLAKHAYELADAMIAERELKA